MHVYGVVLLLQCRCAAGTEAGTKLKHIAANCTVCCIAPCQIHTDVTAAVQSACYPRLAVQVYETYVYLHCCEADLLFCRGRGWPGAHSHFSKVPLEFRHNLTPASPCGLQRSCWLCREW